MADDPALIWQEDHSPPRQKARGRAAEPAPDPAHEPPIPGGRISLREAHHQFGVPASTLASWARTSKVNADKEDGKWMVTPASVAAQMSERHGGKPRSGRKTSPQVGGSTGPIGDGMTMLVPRDAWDKLLDQLGNLHEAGQMLADARERAAKAETEVTFLRERLSEIRGERDDLKSRSEERPRGGQRPPGLWTRLRGALLPETPQD